MADPRKLKSTNVNDYIKNADENAIKAQNKPFLYGIVGAIVLGCGVLGFAYLSANRTPEKSYDELAATPKQVETETETDTSKKGFFWSKDKNKTSKEPDRTLPMYTTQPSDEILSADPLSGSVQIGEYLFELPCKLTAFTDAGFSVVGWGPQSREKNFSLDMPLSKKLGREILIQYNEYSTYAVTVYDNENVALIDSTVVSVCQNCTSEYFDPQATPLFAAGGVHIGSAAEDVDAYFSPLGEYSVNSYGYRIFNGPVLLDISPNNLISMTTNTDLGELESVRVFKNY